MKTSYAIPSRIRLRCHKLLSFHKCTPVASPTPSEVPSRNSVYLQSYSPSPEPTIDRMSRGSPSLSPNATIESINVRSRKRTLSRPDLTGSTSPVSQLSKFNSLTRLPTNILSTFDSQIQLNKELLPAKGTKKHRQITLKLHRPHKPRPTTPPPSKPKASGPVVHEKPKLSLKMFQEAVMNSVKNLASPKQKKPQKPALTRQSTLFSPKETSVARPKKQYRLVVKRRDTALCTVTTPEPSYKPADMKVNWRGKFGQLKKTKTSRLSA